MNRIGFGFILFALGLLSAGCGRGRTPVAVHPVKGQVLYAGKPAAGVKVYLLPTSAPTVPDVPNNPHGVTGSDGNFQLTTFKENDGAAEGGYQVIMVWPPATKSDDLEESDSDRLMGWYGPVHSKLTAQIKTGENVLGPFKLATISVPPSAVEGIPGRN